MKKVSKLPLLAVALMVTGCNEKVSPELQTSNVAIPTAPVTPPPADTTYSFKLVNKITTANYKLHKTGPGNKAADCEIKTTNVPFSRNSFPMEGGNSYDITCYLEAEEWALLEKGINFEAVAAPNTCEYISYVPFGYYNRMPGDSTANYTEIQCGNEFTQQSNIMAALPVGLNINYTGGATAGCNQWLANSALLPIATRNVFTPFSDADLCRFNYQDGGMEKCDIGTVTVNRYQFTLDPTKAKAAGVTAGRTACVANPLNVTCNSYLDASDDDGTGPDDGAPGFGETEITALLTTADADFAPAYNAAYNAFPASVSQTVRKINCGGQVKNCLGGPAQAENLGSSALSVRYKFVEPNLEGKLLATYPPLAPSRLNTYIYSNFRRNLSNSAINYIGSTDPGYANSFVNVLLSIPFTLYDPSLQQQYSFGTSYSAPPSITTWSNADWDAASIVNNQTIGRPLASEAFQGMKRVRDWGVNPFYTFNCLDSAYEIKARIRLLVRDWNRLLPTGTNIETMEYLTDLPIAASGVLIDQPSDWPRQDININEPSDGSGVTMNFNDFVDWDDILGMTITAGKYTVTAPDNTTSVFFTPLAFPNEIRTNP